MSDGWIKLHRCLLDKAIWKCTTMEQKTILVVLLLLASHAEKQWMWKGQKFEIAPGQFVTSLESISSACGKGVSVQNVRTALKLFEKLEFLTNESTKQGRLITITNWARYQLYNDKANKPSNSQLTDGQQTPNRQLTTIKNDKNERMEENTSCPTAKPSDDVDVKKSSRPKPPPYSKEFESFWSAYPKKVGKDAAWRAWRNRNGTRPDTSVLLGAVEASKMTDQWQRDNGQYIPNPSTWINQGRWNDEACAASDPYAAFLAGEIRQ